MVFSGIKSVLWTLDIDTTARGILSGSFTFRVCTKSMGNGMVFTKWQRIWTFCQYAECLHGVGGHKPLLWSPRPQSDENRYTGLPV